MSKLWEKPIWRDQYWKIAIILGPSQQWFYTLSNDLCLTKGRNRYKIIGFYSLLITLSIWYLVEFNYFTNLMSKDWIPMIKLLGLNSVFFVISEFFQWRLLKNEFEEYNSNNGEYAKPKLLGMIIPLGIVFVVYQIIMYILTLF
jgi:hypothetical protein